MYNGNFELAFAILGIICAVVGWAAIEGVIKIFTLIIR